MAPSEKSDNPSVPGDQDELVRAAVIHDVNQMLAVITGRAELLLHRGGQEPSREDLETIALAATDAAAMLRRLAKGSVPAPEESVSCLLADEVKKVSLLVRPPDGKPWAPSRSVGGSGGRVMETAVGTDLVAALPGQVVREVLANLIVNALEAMPTGGGLVITGARHGSRVTLEVVDEGPGLNPEAAERIFEPGTTGHDQPGRGVGLAGSRHLLAGFGAHLDLVTGQGPGAVFRLDMPAAGPMPERTSPTEPERGLDRPAVLVVDDEAGVRGMLIDLLGEMGCRASAARNAEGALDTFFPGRFEVVLLDQSLPDGTGRELAETMRGRDPFVALVLMTGLDRGAEIEPQENDPVDLTAFKPLTWDTIRRLVDQGAALHGQRRKAGDS